VTRASVVAVALLKFQWGRNSDQNESWVEFSLHKLASTMVQLLEQLTHSEPAKAEPLRPSDDAPWRFELDVRPQLKDRLAFHKANCLTFFTTALAIVFRAESLSGSTIFDGAPAPPSQVCHPRPPPPLCCAPAKVTPRVRGQRSVAELLGADLSDEDLSHGLYSSFVKQRSDAVLQVLLRGVMLGVADSELQVHGKHLMRGAIVHCQLIMLHHMTLLSARECAEATECRHAWREAFQPTPPSPTDSVVEEEEELPGPHQEILGVWQSIHDAQLPSNPGALDPFVCNQIMVEALCTGHARRVDAGVWCIFETIRVAQELEVRACLRVRA
jgi:hypothetical protein